MKLNKLIYLYDANSISIDGSTELSFTENVPKRFEAYDWDVQEIDGHDHSQISKAIEIAQNSELPSIIICRTKIGFGSPNKEGKASSHGSPLGEEEIKATKDGYGWDSEKQFFIPDEALHQFRKQVKKGNEDEESWNSLFESYAIKFNDDAVELVRWLSRDLPDNLEHFLPVFEEDEKGMATRTTSGIVLNALKDAIPNMLGGSADLEGSVKTKLTNEGVFNALNYGGRNTHYGVREHAMAAAMNGMALHDGVIPFGGTFLVFTDYCRPAIRLAALMKVPSIFVMTHDSIGLGEDGPTHQPIEHLASLRAMPNVLVLRPGDANEVSYAWKLALENENGPTVLVLTRQNIPIQERNTNNPARLTEKGGYILINSEKETPDAILISTGSELHLAVDAQKVLKNKGVEVRVVSLPSWELFSMQSEEYQRLVLPDTVTNRVAIEAGSTFGWERYVGQQGLIIGIDTFGESAPHQELYEHFGITVEKIVKAVLR